MNFYLFRSPYAAAIFKRGQFVFNEPKEKKKFKIQTSGLTSVVTHHRYNLFDMPELTLLVV